MSGRKLFEVVDVKSAIERVEVTLNSEQESIGKGLETLAALGSACASSARRALDLKNKRAALVDRAKRLDARLRGRTSTHYFDEEFAEARTLEAEHLALLKVALELRASLDEKVAATRREQVELRKHLEAALSELQTAFGKRDFELPPHGDLSASHFARRIGEEGSISAIASFLDGANSRLRAGSGPALNELEGELTLVRQQWKDVQFRLKLREAVLTRQVGTGIMLLDAYKRLNWPVHGDWEQTEEGLVLMLHSPGMTWTVGSDGRADCMVDEDQGPRCEHRIHTFFAQLQRSHPATLIRRIQPEERPRPADTRAPQARQRPQRRRGRGEE